MKKDLSGSHVAIVTPMRADGDVDYAALSLLLEWHIAEGTDGIVVAGTTGESPTLGVREHQELIAKTVAIVNGRKPVIAGVGANATAEAVELTKRAQADGADAGLSVTPYYNRPPQEGLYRHFSAIAEASSLPLILYDVPGRCAAAIDNDTVARLAAAPGIIGIKDAVGDSARAAALRAATGGDFLLFSGDDKTALDYLLAGGDGVISVTANIAPGKMSAMVSAARAGDAETAKRLDEDLRPFHRVQSLESSPIPVKAALAMDGRIAGGIRLPLTPLSARYQDEVAAALAAAKRRSA